MSLDAIHKARGGDQYITGECKLRGYVSEGNPFPDPVKLLGQMLIFDRIRSRNRVS